MCTPLVDQQFGYVRLSAPLLDLTWINTEFSEFYGTISTQFCFTYSLAGVTMTCYLSMSVEQYFLDIAFREVSK